MEVFNFSMRLPRQAVLLPEGGPCPARSLIRATLPRCHASSRDGHSDTFRRGLGLAVADMSISRRHARPLVAEHAGDHRQGHALKNGAAGERVSEIANAHVLYPGFLAYRTPERQVMRKQSAGVRWRGKDVGTLPSAAVSQGWRGPAH